LSSSSVKPRHCVISKEEEQYYIEPCCVQAHDFLYVNGNRVTEKILLSNLDRIIIGTSTVFLFKNPKQEEESQVREADIDYEYVMQEKIDLTEKEVNEEYRKSQNQDDIKLKGYEDENSTQFFDPNNELRRGLHGKLASTYPLVNEANLLVKEFGRNIKF